MQQSPTLIIIASLFAWQAQAADQRGSQWDTDFGPMTIEVQDHNQLLARYPDYNGTVHAALTEDGAIEGIWVQPTSSRRCPTARHGSHYWGKVRWQVLESHQLRGGWSYCDAVPGSEGAWNGSKPTVGKAFAKLFGHVIGFAGQVALSQAGLGGVQGQLAGMAMHQATGGLKDAIAESGPQGKAIENAEGALSLIGADSIYDDSENDWRCNRYGSRRSFRPGC